MGASFSIAVRLADKPRLIAALSLEVIDSERWRIEKQDWIGYSLPSGYFVLEAALEVSEGIDLRSLSEHSDVWTVSIEDYVGLVSEAVYWRDSNQTWRVCHHEKIAPDHIECSGQAPAELQQLCAEAEGLRLAGNPRQSFNYHYDVPPKLFESICGYRPDHSEYEESFRSISAEYFGVISRVEDAPLVSWWRKLFLGR